MKLQKQIWSIFRFSFLVSMINCLLIGNLIAQSNPKGATIASTPDTSKTGNTWAVIVGISKYQNVQGLNYADKDALAFYDYLVNKKGIDSKHVQLLINEKAIASDIYGALDWLNLSIKENDRVIFYFSGHGDVETKTIYQNGFLLANDAPVAAYMTKGTINITFLQQYLETYIAKKAKDVILIVDACRSGKLAGGSQGIQITMHSLGQNWNNQIIKVLSAQEGESSFEDKKWGGGRGVFSYYLVKGLEGLANRNADSVITASELAAYLPFAVADATASVQNPTVSGSPKTNLFTFNKTLLALASQQDNQAETGVILASRGTKDELDPEIEKWYEQYKSYLQKGRLIWGAKQTDTINCAKYFYSKLIKDVRAKTLLPSLKSSFIASLKRKTELKLDEYINSKNSQERFVDPENEAFKEMALAKSLIDSSYILYNYISARLLFIEAYKTKDPKKAITLLKKVIEIEPDASYAYNDLGWRFQDLAPTLINYIKNVQDSAAYYLKKAIELSPTWYGAYITLGNYYYEKKDYVNAIYYDEKAIGIDSLFFGGYMNLHYVYQKANGDKKADSLIRTIINKKLTQVQEGTQNEYYFQNLGYLYQLIKDHENAIKYLQKSLSFNNPNKEFSGTSLFFLAREYEETKDFEQLIKTLKEKIDLEPGNPPNYNDIGLQYYNKKNYNDALVYLKKAVELAVSQQPKYQYTEPFSYFLLGNIYTNLKNYDEVIKIYKEGIKADPNNDSGSDFYGRLSNVYVLKKDYKNALKIAKTALKLHPGKPEPFETIGHLYLQMGNYKEASKNFDQAIKMGPENAEMYYNIACDYSTHKDLKQALEYLRFSLEKGFLDYNTINTDSDLTNIRQLPEFKELLKKYFPDKVK